MALLWIEGFDSYGATNSVAPTNLPYTYPSAVGDTSFRIANGRLSGGKSLNMGSGTQITTPLLGNIQTIVIGFAFRWIGSFANIRIVSLREDDDTTEGLNLRITTGGVLEIYRGNSLLGSTSPTQVITANVWHYVELRVTVHGSTGAYEVRVDGSNVLSDSSVNTRGGSTNNYCNRVRLHSSGVGVNLGATFDDMYILDTTGSANNNFLGNRKVRTIFPNDVGDSTQFTPDTGANHARMSEVGPDGDTSYVESSTSGHKDLYEYGGDVAFDQVNGLMIKTIARVTDVTSYDLINVTKSDTTEDDSDPHTVSSTTYRAFTDVLEEDPDTPGMPWEDGGINAAQFGLKVD